MKILALDSTAKVASVALCEDGKLLGEYTINNGNTHSETILPMIEAMLKLLDLSIDEIDAFAVAAGPGSFTGVRIGAATIKGLAFDSKKPCVGVSTLEALAKNPSVQNGLICPVMNARRNQVYTAIFRARNGILERLLPDSAIAITELDEILTKYDEPVILCGDGYDITASLLTHPVLPIGERLRHQSAFNVALCAMEAIERGESVSDTELSPTYLRLSQAERERNEREAKKQLPI